MGGIVKIKEVLEKHNVNWVGSFCKAVGRGDKIMFWEDKWVGNVILKENFPRLYKLDKNPKALVGERGIQSTGGSWVWSWDWKQDLRGRAKWPI